jgi:hypothetical protein
MVAPRGGAGNFKTLRLIVSSRKRVYKLNLRENLIPSVTTPLGLNFIGGILTQGSRKKQRQPLGYIP